MSIGWRAECCSSGLSDDGGSRSKWPRRARRTVLYGAVIACAISLCLPAFERLFGSELSRSADRAAATPAGEGYPSQATRHLALAEGLRAGASLSGDSAVFRRWLLVLLAAAPSAATLARALEKRNEMQAALKRRQSISLVRWAETASLSPSLRDRRP